MYLKGFDFMILSIILTEQEKNIAESYAKLHNLSLEEAFKQALFEKIEDDYYISVYEEAYKEYQNSEEKSRPIERLWQELNL